ncbi:MAG TPA: hypothetical protein PLL30_04475 [Candidatus Krumholzibacteria bacterium]|nr:hypothetical protein [Candidatus Krumholzibacteria bacterium]HPD71025.1 hypothetical protein [Candidatus Krumholzibacteria bacterium]HRY39275.1 hypothetical protein [Candidatus Krumholzibacteria bacterium]
MRARVLWLVWSAALAAQPVLAQRHTVLVHRPGPSRLAPSPLQLVLEAGAAVPAGDLADDFANTEMGLGAGTGYDLGIRLRYFLSDVTAVGPTFHYANFGDWEDVSADPVGDAYAVRTSVYRYGVDLQQYLAPRRAVVRPYVTVGAAFCHDRYEDWLQFAGTFTTASNNLAFGIGGGVAMGPLELSAVWTYNQTDNRMLPRAGGVYDTEYDWSYLVVRAGVALGGH